MSTDDQSKALQAQVEAAFKQAQPLSIQAGNSKQFYVRPSEGELLDLSGHQGIISYEPTELVIRARAGTKLSDIEQTLAAEHQMLSFEPPYFADSATLGGTVACNLSGPRRPYGGAVRDHVLGCQIINGKAEVLNFGGEVMKNVAGYDVSRLMAGALGTLGVLLDVAIKVVPKPEAEITLVQAHKPAEALKTLHKINQRPYPLSASCIHEDKLYIRLSGGDKAIHAAAAQIGGDKLDNDMVFWHSLKEQRHDFFQNKQALWRLSLASKTPPLDLGDTLYEWGGAQRWLYTDTPAQHLRETMDELEGHATLFRHAPDNIPMFQPLADGLLHWHKQLKHAFDPKQILNPKRLYPEF